MASYTLNVDHWDWVNPETQKVLKLRRGDEVPPEVLDQEGIEIDELTGDDVRFPMFLKKEGDAPKPASTPSPKVPEKTEK